MLIPKALHYTKNHLWLRPVGFSEYFIGITHFAQKQIGAISCITLDLQCGILEKNLPLGRIDSASGAFALIAPVEGTIIAANTTLNHTPSNINEAPYTNWILRIAVNRHIPISELLNHEEYQKLTNDY